MAPTMAELIAPTQGRRFQSLRPAQEAALRAYVDGAYAWHDMGAGEREARGQATSYFLGRHVPVRIQYSRSSGCRRSCTSS